MLWDKFHNKLCAAKNQMSVFLLPVDTDFPFIVKYLYFFNILLALKQFLIKQSANS